MRAERRDSPAGKIAMRAAAAPEKVIRRSFPGPVGAEAGVRVAVERAAYAELIAHAKESLEAEVCGVLAGQFCEDDEGRFVHVEAVIRGNAAVGGATHVTFTQATWDAIHAALEREHPKARIVGWYHTHPGFGVEFSEMDLFIQKNFFAGPGQIALVTDPMSGAVAIAANGRDGIEYLPRYWVDAREQTARVPPAFAPRPAPTAQPGAPADLMAAVKALEARVSQLVEAQDQQRASLQRFLYAAGFLVCAALVAAVGYFIFSEYTSRVEPPRLNSYVPIPIRVGDKNVLVGVGVVQWDVPPELNALLERAAKKGLDPEAAPRRAAGPEPGEGDAPAGAKTAPATKPKPETLP